MQDRRTKRCGIQRIGALRPPNEAVAQKTKRAEPIPKAKVLGQANRHLRVVFGVFAHVPIGKGQPLFFQKAARGVQILKGFNREHQKQPV